MRRRLYAGREEEDLILFQHFSRKRELRIQARAPPSRVSGDAILGQMRRFEAESAPGGRSVARDETEFMAQTTGNEIDAIIKEEASRTRAPITAMGALLDALAQVEGRLALVYVGAGFNTLPAADLAATWRSHYGHLASSSEPKPEASRVTVSRPTQAGLLSPDFWSLEASIVCGVSASSQIGRSTD